MRNTRAAVLSLVVPIYNEGDGLPRFHQSLIEVLRNSAIKSYEVIYIDDGSTDNSSNWLVVGMLVILVLNSLLSRETSAKRVLFRPVLPLPRATAC